MLTTERFYNEPNLEVMSKANCHPNFLKLCTAPFYYDLEDPLSPFGNDYGSDHLFYLEEWYQTRNEPSNPMRWMFKTINEYGFKFTAEAVSKIVDENMLHEIQEVDQGFLDALDHTIIATGLGQLKITGKIDQILLGLSLIAVERQLYLKILQPQAVSNLEVMKRDFLRLDKRMIEPSLRVE